LILLMSQGTIYLVRRDYQVRFLFVIQIFIVIGASLATSLTLSL
jgi:hypothetical protein